MSISFLKSKQKMSFPIQDGAPVGEGPVTFLKQMKPIVPLGGIQGVSVEFIAPDEFPFFSRREKVRCMFHFCNAFLWVAGREAVYFPSAVEIRFRRREYRTQQIADHPANRVPSQKTRPQGDATL